MEAGSLVTLFKNNALDHHNKLAYNYFSDTVMSYKGYELSSLKLHITLGCLLLLSGCVDQQKKEGLFIINVLDKEHFDDCHIKGSAYAQSVHVTLDQLDDFVKNIDKEKSELVFYCSNYRCTASGFAAKYVSDIGFKHVWAYEAGLAEWYQKGLPVQGLCEKAYLKKRVDKTELDQINDISIISTEELAKKMQL